MGLVVGLERIPGLVDPCEAERAALHGATFVQLFRVEKQKVAL